MNVLGLRLLVLLLPLVGSRLAHAETYHVAPGGSDDAAGNEDAPWQTLAHAAAQVAAGDTVVVAKGDYDGFEITTSGTAQAPIHFVADAGVVIDAPSTQDGINIKDASFVIVEGFKVVDSERAGIRAENCASVTIRGNRADRTFRSGILVSACVDIVIELNEVSRSRDQHGIYVFGAGDNPVIRRNASWGNLASGIALNGNLSLGGDGVITGALVEENVVYANGNGGTPAAAISFDGAQDAVVRNNLLFDNHAIGIALLRIEGGQPSTGNLLVNNTVIMASDSSWVLSIDDDSSANVLRNNILFSYNSDVGAIDICPRCIPDFRSDFNSLMNRFTMDDGRNVVTLAEWRILMNADTNSWAFHPDEMFRRPEGFDYRLAESSPAIARGTGAVAPPTDLLGRERDGSDGIDLGAIELCPGCEDGLWPPDDGRGGPVSDEYNSDQGGITCACRVGTAASPMRGVPILAALALCMLIVLRRRAR